MDNPETAAGSSLPANEINPKDEFRKTAYCAHCRRDYLIRSCHTKANTLLTETLISCPRCRRKLKKIRLKDWYDHYVHPDHNQPPKVI